MRLPRARLTVRTMIVMVVALAALASGVVWAINRRSPPVGFPAPARIFVAAVGAVPDIAVTSARPETVNGARAWEIRGTAQDGTVWLIDVLDTGEVVMKEPVAHGPPPSVMVPLPDF